MPRLLDTTTRTGTIADAVNFLLATRGASTLTMRAIAAECRLSPAALSLHYGSRRHMLAVAALATSRARTARMQERARRDGILAFLPREPEEVLDVRAWLAWCELDRDDEALHHTMWWARAEDRALLDVTLDHRMGPPTPTCWSPRSTDSLSRCAGRRTRCRFRQRRSSSTGWPPT